MYVNRSIEARTDAGRSRPNILTLPAQETAFRDSVVRRDRRLCAPATAEDSAGRVETTANFAALRRRDAPESQ